MKWWNIEILKVQSWKIKYDSWIYQMMRNELLEMNYWEIETLNIDKWLIGNEKWKMRNEKWKIENLKWKTCNMINEIVEYWNIKGWIMENELWFMEIWNDEKCTVGNE